MRQGMGIVPHWVIEDEGSVCTACKLVKEGGPMAMERGGTVESRGVLAGGDHELDAVSLFMLIVERAVMILAKALMLIGV